MNETESSEKMSGTERRFEVGVEDLAGNYEHVTVSASSPEEAFRKGERKCGLSKPHDAYQAYELGEDVTHYP